MADTKMNDSGSQGSSMNNDRARSETGSGRQLEQGSQFDRNKEKGAIGGGENRSQTGQPGRSRDELDDSRKETTGSNHQR